ncbi:MAG: Fe-S-containing hydro-lyase [Clostridiaceae bacterium]|nr:Fe-S-containing hydro-lyase [Clostridiaceae bacterium]
MVYNLQTPLCNEEVKKLRAGDIVNISGIIYTARDAAHKRMIGMLEEGKSLPFDIKDQIIYYVGPCPAKPGEVIGSAGPTTSGRVDAYTPKLIELGLRGMIGKGLRDNSVIEAMKRYGAVYLGAIGGAGALIAKTIVQEEIIAFPDLGTEALRKLTVKEFPVTVIIDSLGNNLYETGKKMFRQT